VEETGELVVKEEGYGFFFYSRSGALIVTPGLAPQRVEDFLCKLVVAEAGAEAGFLCNVHISLKDEGQ
jgi:hypothetical protein